ncbi:MAG: ABC-F family ATP-binding cassette domain-containing protein, partial [Ruminococcus sp.]|nr:ABC-F family ATP-binding cassette domain-containing protein [Ruminococcus sp.]
VQNHGNFLMLDEPTNHIDLPTKEVLEQALSEFPGTMLIVSHDRYLLSKIADRVVEVREGEVRSYPGSFGSYLSVIAEEQRAEQEQLMEDKRIRREEEYSASKQKQYRSKQQRADDAKRRARIRQLEEEIDSLETQISGLEKEISTPEVAGNFELMTEKCALLEQLRSEVEDKTEEWASLDE